MNSNHTYFFSVEEVTRDYVAPMTEPLLRDCSLLPWFPDKLEDENWIKQLTAERAIDLVREELSAMQMKVFLVENSSFKNMFGD